MLICVRRQTDKRTARCRRLLTRNIHMTICARDKMYLFWIVGASTADSFGEFAMTILLYTTTIYCNITTTSSLIPANGGTTPPLVNPPPVALPPAPTDPSILLPLAPHSPPRVEDVLRAIQYRNQVEYSLSMFVILFHIFLTASPTLVLPYQPNQCTGEDAQHSAIYEHLVIAQAAAGLEPQGMSVHTSA